MTHGNKQSENGGQHRGQESRSRAIGVVYVFLAAMLFSIGGLCIKFIPWSPFAINGARSLISISLIGFFMWRKKHRLRFNRWVLLGALAMAGTTTLYVCANKLTTAANAIVLQFTAPIFILLFLWLFCKRRPGRLDLIACAVVFGGIVAFFIDGLESGGTLGNLLALLSGVCYAGVFMLKMLPNADSLSSIWLGQAFCVVLGLPFLFLERDFGLPALGSVLGLGLFQMGLAYILFSKGLERVPPVTASLISGIEPVMNPVLVALFYGETLSPLAIVAGLTVVGAIVGYNVLNGRRKAA